MTPDLVPPADPLSRVAVVVVTYRSAATVLNTLHELPLAELAGVVVVDSGSDDGTVEVVRTAALPRVLVVQERNAGFGAGCNRGVERVPPTADHVLLLNPDARVSREAVLALSEHLSREPRCALVAPRVVADGQPQHSAGELATLLTELRYVLPAPLARLVRERRYPPGQESAGRVPVVEGCCMMVRREDFLLTGGFDERQFLYFEEHQIARDLARLGREVHLLPDAVVEHAGGASVATVEGGRDRLLAAGTVSHLRWQHGWLQSATYRVVAMLCWSLRSALGGFDRQRARELRAGVRSARQSTPGVFVSWIGYHGRSDDLARRLGLRPVFHGVGTTGRRRWGVVRYAVQSLRTTALLIVRRPSVVVVMSPPDLLLQLALLYGRLTGARVVADAHSAAVLDKASGELRNSFHALAQSCDAVWVTNQRLRERLVPATAFVLDDPPEVIATSPDAPSGRPLVVFPASWERDEPWEQVLRAAESLPDIDFSITGRPPASIDTGAWPANCRSTGYLAAPDYDALLSGAAVVLALTTREDTMQRAGYEALAHLKPLVASDTAVLRDYFDDAAVYAGQQPDDLAAAVVTALTERRELARRAQSLRERRIADFEAALSTVRDHLGRP